MLANLCLSTAAEAKALVPTLNDIRFQGEDGESTLQEILSQIQSGALTFAERVRRPRTLSPPALRQLATATSKASMLRDRIYYVDG